MARPAQPAELAPAFVFLACDESRYVTGEILGADRRQAAGLSRRSNQVARDVLVPVALEEALAALVGLESGLQAKRLARGGKARAGRHAHAPVAATEGRLLLDLGARRERIALPDAVALQT